MIIRQITYFFLSIIFVLCNFSFEYDHYNKYSNSEFSYIESVLNILWQIFGYVGSISLAIYFLYCLIKKKNLCTSHLLLICAFTLISFILQILILICFFSYVFFCIYKIRNSHKIKSIAPRTKKKIIYKETNKSEELISALNEFHVYGEISNVHYGTLVTLYEFIPKPGTKSSRIISLSDDIARIMKCKSIRIAIITGKNSVGIEISNDEPNIVSFDKILNSDTFQNSKYMLPIILGEDIIGDPFVADLTTMPHLLVAGTTGSGKSVGINSMIMSLIHKVPSCKLVLIDPKRLEFSKYTNHKQLLYPIIYEPEEALKILNEMVDEMNNRYNKLSKASVRSIQQYRRKMPYIIIVIDEFADLISVLGKKIEYSIQRLSQMARAAGIHIILATQRPSVNVITGTIKSNFPSRIAYKLSSKIDSRIVLECQGAEQLIGNGDMLYLPSTGRIIRLHSPYIQ